MAIINGTGKTVYGTNDADTITVKGPVSAYGRGGNDHITGDSAANALWGDAGNDRVWSKSGNDALFGGDGDDQLYGEAGDDKAWGGNGNDYVHGGSGNDSLRGDAGNDRLHSGGGLNDNLNGGDGNDTLIMYGREGNPVIGGESEFIGGSGYDTLIADIQGTYGEDNASMTAFYLAENGTGSVAYAADWTEYTPVNAAKFSGIEEFQLADLSQPMMFFASADAKIVGGNGGDLIVGREGDQIIDGGGSGDVIRFQYSDQIEGLGHDTVLNYQKDLDTVQTNGFTDYETGDVILTTTMTVSNGNTTYTSVNESGNVMHVVDFIGVTGLPADMLSNEYILG